MWKGSLRNKIVTWSIIPTAVILGAVALVSLYTYQRVTENLVFERDRELTRLSAKLLATELAAYTNPVADQYLAIFDGLIVFDKDGDVLVAEPIQYEKRRPDWWKYVSAYRMSNSSEPVFSDVLVDSRQEARIIVVVMPFAGEESSGGGVAGFFRLDVATDGPFARTMDKVQRGESNCVYLVDGNGRVIYHPNPAYVGQDFSGQEEVQQVLRGQAGTLRTQDLGGRDIVASFAPVPGTPWSLVSSEDWATLTEASRRYGQWLILLLALGVAMPTFVATLGVRRITQPIGELIRAAQDIASGDFGQRIQARTGDELEELAGQFNRMAAQLEDSYRHLERKVADRTKELATLNAIAAEVSNSLDLNVILDSALAEVLHVMNMHKGQAFCLDEGGNFLALMAHRGLSEEFLRDTLCQPVESSVVGLAAREGKPVIRRVADYPPGRLKELAQRESIRTVISSPLVAQGKTVGVIDLGAETLRRVTPEELSLLTAIGQQIGVAAENARLYEQAQQLAVVRERNRLARDLHDSVTQTLYGTMLYAEAAARQIEMGQTDLVAGHLGEIRSTTQEALWEMRLLIFELRPPILENEGLAVALQARLEAVEGRVGLETEFTARGNGRLSARIEEEVYRIAQEALNNVLRHAQAKHVRVCLDDDGHRVVVEIVDDGIGFDPLAAEHCGGLGLCGMAERAARLGGELVVESEPGQGTKIRVEVCS